MTTESEEHILRAEKIKKFTFNVVLKFEKTKELESHDIVVEGYTLMIVKKVILFSLM